MVDVKSAFVSKIERGITFSFMKLDASKEPVFAALFDSTDYPYVVVLNPGKRKRFLRHEGKVDVKELTKTLDVILGGDARFKAIKDNRLIEGIDDLLSPDVKGAFEDAISKFWNANQTTDDAVKAVSAALKL